MRQFIRQQVDMDEIQFGFIPGCGTTNPIIILRQWQGKYIAKNKKLYFASADLEKVFYQVPRDVVWWDLTKLGLQEWLVKIIRSMYKNARSRCFPGSARIT